MPRFLKIVYLSLGLSLSLAGTTTAATFAWPGAAPCDATLAACLAGVAANSIISLHTDGPIDEDINVNKPLSLVAGIGFLPTFAAGRGITAYYGPGAGVAWAMTFDGLRFIDGSVGVRAFSGDATVTLHNLDIYLTTASYVGGGLGIDDFGGGHLTFDIAGNQIRTNNSLFVSMLAISAGTGGILAGTIHDNRLQSDSAGGDEGIAIIASSGSAPNLIIYSNQVRGNVADGAVIWVSGHSNLLLANNSFTSSLHNGYGISLSLFNPTGNSYNAKMYNNSVVGFSGGMTASNQVTGKFTNNLLALNSSYGILLAAGITEDHNLFFANGTVPATLGAGSLVADPLLRAAPRDSRLQAGSPAIDAGDGAALRTIQSDYLVADIDADGSRRFKGSSLPVDIGAFEYGDSAVLLNTSVANGGLLNDPSLNGNPAAAPQLTQNQTPDSYLAGAFDPAFTGLSYTGSQYAVVDEADGSAPVLLSAYNIFNPALGNGSFQHTTSAANVSGTTTTLNDSSVNLEQQRIVLATHHGPTTLDAPFGLSYGFGSWSIRYLGASSTFPLGVKFDIYAQDPSLTAFSFYQSVTGPSAAINNVLMNGEPCARANVTSSYINPHGIALKYTQGRWYVVNIDATTIPAGTTFNVVIDEAATDFCRYDHIFHAGYEAPL